MDGVDVQFDKVQELPSRTIYAHIKRSFQKHKGAEAIYMLGSGWRTLDIIAKLERDLGVPVVHPVTPRAWEIQKRLRMREPVAGYCNQPSWRCATTQASSTRPSGSVSTSARSTASK